MAYLLISVRERNIRTQQFDSFEEARAQMMDELGSEFARERVECGGGNLEEWERIAECDAYDDEDCEFAFGKTEAWSNMDSDHNFDWKIVQLD